MFKTLFIVMRLSEKNHEDDLQNRGDISLTDILTNKNERADELAYDQFCMG